MTENDDDAQARRVREIRDRVESYPENRDPSCLNCDTHVLLARVDALTTQRDALQQRVATCEQRQHAINALLDAIVTDPCDCAEDECCERCLIRAIQEYSSAALAAAATPGDRGEEADG